MIDITLFESRISNTGARRSLTWDDFAKELSHKPGTKDGPAFAAGTFISDVRKSANAESRSLVVLDIERLRTSGPDGAEGEAPPAPDEIVDRLKQLGFAGVVYTTHSHTSAEPRYRVVSPLDRILSIGESTENQIDLERDRDLAKAFAKELGVENCVDSSKFGIASIFYAPRCPQERLDEAKSLTVEGQTLPTDRLLQLAAAVVGERRKTQARKEQAAMAEAAHVRSRNTNEESLIERIRASVPSLQDALKSEGYKYVPASGRWLSPHSKSGIPGCVILKGADGVDRVYIHHASDPLCGDSPVFGARAHDVIDVMIAGREGTDDDAWAGGLKRLAAEFDMDSVPPHKVVVPSPSSDEWQQPLPFVEALAAKPYPLEALPGKIRLAVEEVHAFVQAPVAMVACSAIGALSLAGQAYLDVERSPGLKGPCSLFLLTIADSGERKSSCDGYFTEGLRRFEREAAERAKPLLKKFESDLQIWEQIQKGLKDKLAKVTKDGKATDEDKQAYSTHMSQRPEPPRVPRLFFTDTTPEALARALRHIWPSAGVMSSEAGLVFGGHGMAKDAATRNLSLYNVLWDGGSIQIDRATSTSFSVQGARLTISLQVQSATMQEFLRSTGGLARGTGFLARFLLCWPESTQGTRLFREAPRHWPHQKAFNERLFKIVDADPMLDDDSGLRPLLIDLSPEAKALWVAFHDNIERQLKAGGDYHDVRDVASKIADNAARLAGLFHVFSGDLGSISADAFKAAAPIVEWHLHESRRFFGEMTLPEEFANAVRVERWLLAVCKRKSIRSVRRNEIRQKGPVRDTRLLDAALKELVQLGRVRKKISGRSNLIEINPALLCD